MNQDRIWDAFQNDHSLREAFQAASRFRQLLALTRRGDRILNIGVGDGGFERLASAQGRVVFCLDPNQQSIDLLRTTLALGERAQQGYSDAIPFADDSFDAVVMSEVIEHLDDRQIAATLPEVGRVLAPGGRFIGTVPADENLAHAQAVCPHCGERFHRWGHVQSFTCQRLKTSLSAHFEGVRIVRGYFPEWERLNWKGKAAALVKKRLVALGVTGRDETFLFEAARAR